MGEECLQSDHSAKNDRDARVKALYYTMRSLEVDSLSGCADKTPPRVTIQHELQAACTHKISYAPFCPGRCNDNLDTQKGDGFGHTRCAAE